MNRNGGQLDCEYGSVERDNEQSLHQPWSLCRVDEEHFLVVDHHQHRIHLLTSNLQLVRHLIRRQDPNDPNLTLPRHVCLIGGNLYVGTDSGTVSIYRVQQAVL